MMSPRRPRFAERTIWPRKTCSGSDHLLNRVQRHARCHIPRGAGTAQGRVDRGSGLEQGGGTERCYCTLLLHSRLRHSSGGSWRTPASPPFKSSGHTMGLIFSASSPSGPDVMSKDTFCFIFRDPDLSPARRGVKRAKMSLPPRSGVTSPKPFSSLIHLMIPVVMSAAPESKKRRACARARELQGERND